MPVPVPVPDAGARVVLLDPTPSNIWQTRIVNSLAPRVFDTSANRQAIPDANPDEWVSSAVAAKTIGFLASRAVVAIRDQHLTLDM